ncbi:MAG TPA: transglutaminaseTgpA domain-containing protein [Acidimicrobiales bacterium]|nr:transglutaminaseTgpA domain-containing protein [Acidimicrobiales bacterium]
MLTLEPARGARHGELLSPETLDGAVSGTPGGRPPDRAGATSRLAGGDSAATLALTALSLASLFGLTRVFTSDGWVGPVLVTCLVVHLVSWFARSRGWRSPAGVASAAVAGLLLISWTVLGSHTTYGLPTHRTLSAASTALRAANRAVSSVTVPVQPTTGFVLATALVAGLAALAGDWLAFRRRSAVLGALPAFAMFVAYCALGYGGERVLVVTAEGVGLLVFALVHRASVGVGTAWIGGVRTGSVSWSVTAGAVVSAAAVLTVLLAAPSAHGTDGEGLLGWRAAGIGSGGPREVANPIVDLHTRLVSFGDVGVFTVQSPVASYWRLTSLDTFTGQAWVSTNSYKGFSGRLPGTSTKPAGTRTVTEHFRIQNLASVWLPVAFTPLSVSGVRGVSFDPTSSSLITSHRTSDGLEYSVTSYQYLSTLDPAQLRAAPALKPDQSIGHYLQLPPSVPSSVYSLARSITSGKRTEYDKALALQSFFLGPSFTYSLNPPDDGFGVDALTTFLFDTRTGYCQQFAGAYAVLARAAGLPTRLAVGFAPGSGGTGTGSYQVYDRDAHTWPEVYFGPKYGWLPFEPTKSFNDPNAATYAPGVGGSGPTKPTGSDLLPAAPKGTATTQPQGAPPTSAAPAGRRLSGGGSPATSPGAGGWAVLVVIVLLLAGWVSLNAAFRRARWALRRRRHRDDPGSLVLSYWADTAEVLSWWGIHRAPGDTDAEFARRAAVSLRAALGEPSPWVASGVRRLSALASEATFSPSVAPSAPEEASMVAAEVRQRLFRKASARRLLLWALTPRLGGAQA